MTEFPWHALGYALMFEADNPEGRRNGPMPLFLFGFWRGMRWVYETLRDGRHPRVFIKKLTK
jgi:hypothetical protein